MSSRTIDRRSFVGAGVAMLALAACKKGAPKDAPKEGTVPLPTAPNQHSNPPTGTIATRALGMTGVNVSMVGLGGFHIGIPKSEAEAVRIIRSAIDRGVTFLDNCWDYHDGKSEERMGKALADGYRQKAFLMTKLDGRTKQAAAEQIDQSLKRLNTDVIDLVQIHEVIRMGDPARCFAEGGCIEALIDAKKAGKLRFIGFTGHKDPNIHLTMLKAADAQGFRFDTVQMPLNAMDVHFKSFQKNVLPVLVEKKIGVLGMKPLCSGKILESKRVSAVECLHYAMSLPTSVVITGCDSMGVLDQAIHAALTFAPLSPEAIVSIETNTKDAGKDGKYESFKTSTEHDGTTKHPEWLESASI